MAILRVARFDNRSARVFAIQSLSAWLYLPAYGALAVAVTARSRTLAFVAGVVVLMHLLWVGPGVLPTRSRAAAADRGVVVATANIAGTNDDARGLAKSLNTVDADVLVIHEFTPALRTALEQGSVTDRYRYRFELPRSDFFGVAIYSRFPLHDQRSHDLVSLPVLEASVDAPGGPVRVFAVHTIQPLADHGRLVAQLEELARIVDHPRTPTVVAGDFNANHHHRGFRRLLGAGLRDAHLERGRGLARTWPADRGAPPFVLLDHVLVSEHLSVRAVSEFTITGSDHRGVRAELTRAD